MAFSTTTSLPTPMTPSMPLCTPVLDQFEPLPITPPDVSEKYQHEVFKPDDKTIEKALHVLTTEGLALAHLERFYATSKEAQTSLLGAISQIVHSESHHGKIVFTGIGKSRHIATKLAATFNSLGIHAVSLHPTEALHGDLGIIRPNDTLLMITFSGRTPELLALLPYIPPQIPLIIMTSHLNSRTCPLLTHPMRVSSKNFLLPTIIPETEISSFGISAPTTSTTITLALGDSLALTAADALHSTSGLKTPSVFAANHPGGAIGAALSDSAKALSRISSLAVKVAEVPIAVARPGHPLRCLDILLAAARSPSGFVRTSPHHLIAPRRIQKMSEPTCVVEGMMDEKGNVIVEQTDWISVLADTSIEEAKQWVCKMREEGDGRGKEFLRPGTVFGTVQNNEVTGVVEIEELLGEVF